jgi:hypothetical protein
MGRIWVAVIGPNGAQARTAPRARLSAQSGPRQDQQLTHFK